MSDPLLLDVYRGLTGFYCSTLNQVLPIETSETLGREIDKSIRETLSDSRYEKALAILVKAIRLGGLEHFPNELRSCAQQLFAVHLRMLNCLVGWVRKAECTGQEVASAADLVSRLRAVEAQRDALLAHWPEFTSADLEFARSEYDRGECLDAEDAFAQAAGISKERYLELVAARDQQP